VRESEAISQHIDNIDKYLIAGVPRNDTTARGHTFYYVTLFT